MVSRCPLRNQKVTYLHGLGLVRIVSTTGAHESCVFRSRCDFVLLDDGSSDINYQDALSSSISSSNSTSPPGDLESALMKLRASLGRLKLVLRLEVPERTDMDVPGRPPLLDTDVRRDEGPDVLAPVDDAEIAGDKGR